MQIPQRVLFNLLKKNKDKLPIPFDSFLIRDIVFAASVLMVYIVVLIFGEKMATSKDQRLIITVITVFSCVCGLTKLFLMFLCIEEMSILLQTMFAMLADTMPVLSVLASYFIIFVQVSLTLYTDLQPDYYNMTINATRWSFDGFLGTYDFNMLMKPEF